MTVCSGCDVELRTNAKFCDECGSPVGSATTPAEYKQVTVLFADVVHSMDIAAALGPERLREVMGTVFDCCAGVVQRYGGTVDKFTGDGIMAVFGAPVSLEDHAFRACMAALEIQAEAPTRATQLTDIALQLRIGLNSGRVIVGDVGSGKAGYTAIGEQVGLAQRMESVAPPGGVVVSESTARLVEGAVALGAPEQLHVKGSREPLCAQRLLGLDHHELLRTEPTLVGRTWELNALIGILDEAVAGDGCVASIMGPPGIGKSRLVRETTALAITRGVPVFTAHCESHTTGIPFHALSQLLRTAMRIDDLDAEAARSRVRAQSSDVVPDDQLLIDDLLGIGGPAATMPAISPDERRRRLTTLFVAASLAQTEPTVYVIEDAHWIDEVSESMLAEFFAVIPQTPSLVLITYRPEYRGALSRVPGAQNLTLRPLKDTHALALTAELLGSDPSLDDLRPQITARAAGNPYFAAEIVRDLAERRLLRGVPGKYLTSGPISDDAVPATLQAAISARIDRLPPAAKQTLNAAAVIGSRFDTATLTTLVDRAQLPPLIDAELIEQVKFAPQAQYAFRHPLIRSVAYESQLRSDRAEVHGRIAEAIESGDGGSADENAALIAEHWEAAGDLHAAYTWHMRAATWSNIRDNQAAANSWRRAQRVADLVPTDDPDQLTMRIAPRALLYVSAGRIGGRGSDGADGAYDELRELCAAAGDERSLASATAGRVIELYFAGLRLEASQLADNLDYLLDAIDDPAFTLAHLIAAMVAKFEVGEMSSVLRLAQKGIDLADGDSTKGDLVIASPLAYAKALRGGGRLCFGTTGWRDDFSEATAMARDADPISRGSILCYTYITAASMGALQIDEDTLRQTDEMYSAAQNGKDS